MKLSLPCALDVISPKPSESQCPSRLRSPRLIGPGPLPQMGKAWFVEALPHLGEGSHLGKFIVTFLPDWGGRSHSPHVIEPTAGRGPSRSVGWRGAALAFPRQNVQEPLAGRLLEKVAARDVALGTTCPILEGLCSFVHLLRHLSPQCHPSGPKAQSCFSCFPPWASLLFTPLGNAAASSLRTRWELDIFTCDCRL